MSRVLRQTLHLWRRTPSWECYDERDAKRSETESTDPAKQRRVVGGRLSDRSTSGSLGFHIAQAASGSSFLSAYGRLGADAIYLRFDPHSLLWYHKHAPSSKTLTEGPTTTLEDWHIHMVSGCAGHGVKKETWFAGSAGAQRWRLPFESSHISGKSFGDLKSFPC